MKSQERESDHVLPSRALGCHWGCENRSPLYRNLLFDNGLRYAPKVAYLSMYYLNEKISFKWGGEGGEWGKGGEDVLCLIEQSQSRSLMLQASLPDLKESNPKS